MNNQLRDLARRLLDGCRDSVTGEKLYGGESSTASVEDVESAARYLRDCAEAEPVATVRVHDTGGNAGMPVIGTWDGRDQRPHVQSVCTAHDVFFGTLCE